jgi:hypothetical protein
VASAFWHWDLNLGTPSIFRPVSVVFGIAKAMREEVRKAQTAVWFSKHAASK